MAARALRGLARSLVEGPAAAALGRPPAAAGWERAAAAWRPTDVGAPSCSGRGLAPPAHADGRGALPCRVTSAWATAAVAPGGAGRGGAADARSRSWGPGRRGVHAGAPGPAPGPAAPPAADASASGPPMAEDAYSKLADVALEHLHEMIEAFVEDCDLDDSDVTYGQGVLTIKLGRAGTFVLNKQTPNRQIWLSSPLTGPFRYDYLPEGAGAAGGGAPGGAAGAGAWRARRDGHALAGRLQSELSKACGRPCPSLEG